MKSRASSVRSARFAGVALLPGRHLPSSLNLHLIQGLAMIAKGPTQGPPVSKYSVSVPLKSESTSSQEPS